MKSRSDDADRRIPILQMRSAREQDDAQSCVFASCLQTA